MYLTVTQVCVQTDEMFVSDLKLPLHAIAQEFKTNQEMDAD